MSDTNVYSVACMSRQTKLSWRSRSHRKIVQRVLLIFFREMTGKSILYVEVTSYFQGI